jgi:Flp pilus assembly secretin CpaC
MKAAIRDLAVRMVLLLSMLSVAQAEDRTVALRPGVASRLWLDKAYETVLIGTTDIVDVHVDDDHSVLIEPLNPGIANLVFVDDRSIAVANIRIQVCAPDRIQISSQGEASCEP